MTPFVLNNAEKASALGQRLKDYLEHELQVQRERNDNPESDAQGERIRGRIAQLKELVALFKKDSTEQAP